MSNSRYYIVGNDDVWMIQFKGTENGQYRSSNAMASFASAAAQKLAMRGERAHVCVLDDDGYLRRKWTYNRDHHHVLAARNSPQEQHLSSYAERTSSVLGKLAAHPVAVARITTS